MTADIEENKQEKPGNNFLSSTLRNVGYALGIPALGTIGGGIAGYGITKHNKISLLDMGNLQSDFILDFPDYINSYQEDLGVNLISLENLKNITNTIAKESESFTWDCAKMMGNNIEEGIAVANAVGGAAG
jgi:hypothetical protein